MSNLWENNRVQFIRLISEINAIGLSPEQYQELSESMDLEIEFIDELFDRAEVQWQEHKKIFDTKHKNVL
jgi:hypothetical protein